MDPTIGDKLWRPIEDGEPVDLDFGPRNERDQITLRAQYSTIWVAVTNESAGMVCFCKLPIPDDWTFMLVIAVSSKTLFVEPRSGSREDLLNAHS